MRGALLHSLLELAHATSQNLGFAHQDDVHVTYGEETITETNLLELRRRHPTIITLSAFSKKKESLIGADWEWHIMGQEWKFRMRVQAKRLTKKDVLSVKHKVKSSGQQQIDLLIANSKMNQLMPVYCIYADERQREHWKKENIGGGYEAFEAGCLLANAHTVLSKMPKRLADIEADCVPWHYLAERKDYAETKVSDVFDRDAGKIKFSNSTADIRFVTGRDRPSDRVATQSFPTLDELNTKNRPTREIEGLVEKTDPEYERRRSEGEYRERGIGRLVEIDLREFPDTKPPEGGEND